MKKIISKVGFTVSLISLIFSGCGALKVNEYKPVKLKVSTPIPKVQSVPRVVMVEFTNSNIGTLKNGRNKHQGTKLGIVMMDHMDRAFRKYGMASDDNIGKRIDLINVVKTNYYGRLKDKKISPQKLLNIEKIHDKNIDYLITAKLCSINYRNWITGKVRIYSVKNNKLVNESYLNGQITYHDNRIKTNGTMREAIQSLKNLFAVKGYILEMRKKSDKVILKTTLGYELGGKSGDNVIIYNLKNKKIGEGKISYTLLTKNYSWIEVNKITKGYSLNQGYYIKSFHTGVWKRDSWKKRDLLEVNRQCNEEK